jgi:aromatic ring-opening dioxygenase LigB subunit
MGIVSSVLVPHPPILLPEVGRGEERRLRATTEAYEAAARFVAEARPDAIVITTPHSVLYRDYFHISPGEGARGDFARFGAPELRVRAAYDRALRWELCRLAQTEHFPAGTEGERDPALDHATMIPLLFLQRAYGAQPLPPIVRIGLSGLPLTEHYRLGMLIRAGGGEPGAAGERYGQRRPLPPAQARRPLRLPARGPGIRPRMMDVMGRADFGELFSFSDGFCEAAGECGHRSFTIMAGMPWTARR